jgi:hypothetical protein
MDGLLPRRYIGYNFIIRGRGQVARHQPSKLIFAGSNPVARSVTKKVSLALIFFVTHAFTVLIIEVYFFLISYIMKTLGCE